MDQQLNKILSELYELDPSLRGHEQALRKIVMVLLKTKKEIRIDQGFKNYLRQELEQLAAKENRVTKENLFDLLKLKPMKKLSFALAGALCLVLIVTLALQNKNNKTFTTAPGSITQLADNAFGPLGAADTASGAAPTAPSTFSAPSSAMPAYGRGGGVGAPNTMIYRPVQYVFKYTGDELSISEDKLEVLRKAKIGGTSLDNILNGFRLGDFDASGFSGMKIDSFTASERNGSYTITADLTNGSAYIYKQPEPVDCGANQGPKCSGPIMPQLNLSDVPGDQALIDIADAFLKAHRIDASKYGKPEIQNDWRQYANASQIYVPDIITVIYPAEAAGIKVYDQSGGVSGMAVGVNIRTKQVMNVSEINLGGFESSLYATEKDFGKIVSIAEKGGTSFYQGNSEKKSEVQLGTPSIALMRYWNYSGPGGTDLYVPAMVFPVVHADEGFTQKNVVVPIIKDILDKIQSQPPIGIMEPMMTK